MPLSTNTKIAIAVGATAAIGLIAASVFAAPQKQTATPSLPSAPTQLDVFGVLDKAAKYETDLTILKDLRDRVLAASLQNNVWDPYLNKLNARLAALSPAEALAQASIASSAVARFAPGK